MPHLTRLIFTPLIVLCGLVVMAHDTNDTPTSPPLAINKAETPADTSAQQNNPRDFTFNDLHGKPRKLSEWQGQIIVLNFWATWCRPCLDEIPMFNAVSTSMNKNNVRFIGIAVDDLATVEAFIQRTGMHFSYPVLIGNNDAIPVAIAYGNTTGILPYTVIIDAKGIPVFHHYGLIRRALLVSELNKLLRHL